MNEEQKNVLDWIDSLQSLGIKLGLQNTQTALELMENPQKNFKSIIVTGTNGKGSVSAFLSHVLQANGYKTGLYTSPHLVRHNERFQINQQPIGDNGLFAQAGALKKILEANRLELTQFEFLTVLALNWFAEKKADWVVLEVGMGGRLDATNAVEAEAACIANIALDHQQYLGNTTREIAFEKAGIIKKEKPIVTSERNPEIVQLFSELASSQKAPFFAEGKEYYVQFQKTGLDGTVFDFSGFGLDWKGLETKLIGEHQCQNAGLALATLCCIQRQQSLRLAEEKTRKALQKTAWPGRFEVVSKEPLVVLDAGHNPAGLEATAKTIQAVFPGKKFKTVFGISEGRKPSEMLKWIAPFSSEIGFARAAYKGVPVEELQKAGTEFFPSYKIKGFESVSKAVSAALKNSEPTGAFFIGGSIYLVGEALQNPALRKLRKKKR